MEYSYDAITILAVAQMLLVVAISFRVIMNRPATGVALAWLVIVALIPNFGAAAYLIIGERRISPRRMARLSEFRVDFRRFTERTIREGLNDVDWSRHPPAARSMDVLGINTAGIPTVTGSSFELIADTQDILLGIARDIDAARTSVLMEFYIWHAGGTADIVANALVRAAGRDVHCVVLVDALGAGLWWRSKQPAMLRNAGVQLQPALPVGIFRSLVGRTDLRLHRKIVIIDGEIAWTGSMNLVDPRFFQAGERFLVSGWTRWFACRALQWRRWRPYSLAIGSSRRVRLSEHWLRMRGFTSLNRMVRPTSRSSLRAPLQKEMGC